ncbi:HAD family hydrolase [Bacteroidota bacterium]
MNYLILFDIDGTILQFKKYNSREIFAGMLKEIFGREVPVSIMPDFSGMTDLQILKEIASRIDLPNPELEERLPEVWSKIFSDFKEFCTPEYINLLPGIPELLKILDTDTNVTLGLQTGNFKDNAYMKLKTFNLEKYFPFGAFGSDHEDRNMLPPIAVKRANEHHGQNMFSQSNTLIIGDSIRDIECAKSNNLPVLAVATGSTGKHELARCEPDAVLDNFSDNNRAIEIIFDLLNAE